MIFPMRVHTIPYGRVASRFPPFFVSWMEGEARTAGLLPAAPFDREAIRACAVERLAGTFPRRELADALARRHRALGSPAAVLDRIESMRANDTFCVITGQQPLLAGGPLLVVCKALTLLALAREIESRLGFRCVPLFWNHSDDHDIAEVDRLGIPDRDNRLRILRAGFPPGRQPLWQVEDEDRMEAFRRELAGLLPETSFRSAVAALLDETFCAGPAGWFTRLMTRLFGGEGLVVFEPRWVAREAAPLLARVVEAPGRVAEALEAGGRALGEAGFPRPLGPAGTGLFVVHNGERTRLDADGKGFALADGTTAYTAGRIVQMLGEHPERVTPGAALRAVVQDALFPTLAAVAGPNEAAYLAQLGPLYAAFGVARPPVVPRASATIAEPKMTKVVDKFGLSWEAALAGEGAPPGLPADLQAAFDAARSQIEASLDRLRQVAAGIEPGLERQHAKSRERVLETLGLYSKKVADAAARAGGVAEAQGDKLRVHLAPEGALQERTMTGLYYLALFGPDFYRRLGESLDFTARGHQVVEGGT